MSRFNFFVGIVLLAFVCQKADSQIFYQQLSRACEGYNLNLACSPGYMLNIAYANYGRLLPGCLACPKFGADFYTLCFSTNATTTMRARCNDRENCSVPATNAVFGNPCLLVYKYLVATYSCIPYKRVCEGSTLNITCPAGQSIMVLSANFGRTLPGTVVCQYAANNNATTNTNCIQPNSTQIISSICNYQNTCSVQASNSVFGDPCPGTYKYLQVSYYCT